MSRGLTALGPTPHFVSRRLSPRGTIPALAHCTPLAYSGEVVVVETRMFSRMIQELLPDEAYRRLQIALVLRPEQGALIRGAGGLRKVRWSLPGRGKSGALRVFYYWDPKGERIYMIYVIEKTKQADLTPAQTKELGRVVREELA